MAKGRVPKEAVDEVPSGAQTGELPASNFSALELMPSLIVSLLFSLKFSPCVACSNENILFHRSENSIPLNKERK